MSKKNVKEHKAWDERYIKIKNDKGVTCGVKCLDCESEGKDKFIFKKKDEEFLKKHRLKSFFNTFIINR